MSQPTTARDRLDRVLAVGRRARRFVWPALAIAVIGAAATVAYALLRPPVYRSETLILCRGAVHAVDVAGGGLPTRARLEPIVRDSHLYGEIIEERGIGDAVEELRRHMTVRAQDGDAVSISFEGNRADRVRNVTAALADALIRDAARGSDGNADVGKEILERDRDRVGDDLKDKERALAQFVAKHPEFARETAQSAQKPAPAPAARAAATAKIDTTLAFLERETARLKERLDQPVAKKRSDAAPQADPQLVAAQKQAEGELGKAQRELEVKQGQFTDEHPDVRAARVHVREAQDKLRRASDAVAANLSTQQGASDSAQDDQGYIDRGALENQLKRINDEIAEYKRRKANAPAPPTAMASSVVALENDWVRLNSNVAEAREHLASVEQEQRKADLAPAATSHPAVPMVVADSAFLPTHEAAPRRETVIVAGVATSLLLSLLLAFGLALVDDRIYDRHDVERLGSLPLIGVVPRSTRDKKVSLG